MLTVFRITLSRNVTENKRLLAAILGEKSTPLFLKTIGVNERVCNSVVSGKSDGLGSLESRIQIISSN